MLMKRIGKMKQKKGAVLFAVIAVMSLLIAMASTAYYTARSAYNSVISNYDYSQLYLSATSVSDMVVEAMAYEPAQAAAVHNDFTPLRKAVFGESVSGTGIHETGLVAVGQKVVARSAQISETNANLAGAARDAAIIAELSTQDSLVAGAVDGIIVEVELLSKTHDAARSKVENLDKDADGPDTDGDNSPYTSGDTTKPELIRTTTGFDYTYVYRTIAYYRNNTITVEDIVTFEKTFIEDLKPGDPGYNNIIDKYKEYTVTTKGGASNLNTFFTSTGHIKNQENEVTVTSSTVKLNTHLITDDSYFQNDHTIFYGQNNNAIKAGVTSTGSLYLQKAKINVTEDDNDWFIGENLVLTDDQAVGINLGTNNNLYVGGDLVFSNQQTITAGDIYVQGDLYVIGAPKFEGNLHVLGNIYYQIPETHEAAKVVTENNLTSITEGKVWDSNTNSLVDGKKTGGAWSVSGTLDVGGSQVLPDGVTSQSITVGGKTVTVGNVDLTGAKDTEGNVRIGDYDETAKVTITNRVPNETTDRYESVETEVTVEKAIESKTYVDKENLGTNNEDAFTTYDNFTSPPETYSEENTLNIDVSLLEPIVVTVKDGGNTVEKFIGYSYPPIDGNTGEPITETTDLENLGYSAEEIAAIQALPEGFSIKSEEIAPENLSQAESKLANSNLSIEINIPYNSKTDSDGNTVGWTLDIADTFGDKIGANAAITYNIDSGSDPKASMPIVLKDNILIDDNTGKVTTEETGVKSFSWRGSSEFNSQAGNNDSATNIVATGTGNVVFEMANIDADGNYGPYNENSTKTVVRYMAGSKEAVGNQKQIDAIVASGYQFGIDQNTGALTGAAADMLGPDSTPNAGYDNQFMLVSNANNVTAVDVARQNNIFCGYVYSPNGVLAGTKWFDTNGDGKADSEADCGQTNPIFGGMIVSTYNSKLSPLVYAEPQISRIESMISSLYSEDGNNGVDIKKVKEWIGQEVEKRDPTAAITDGEIKNGDGATLVGSNYVG